MIKSKINVQDQAFEETLVSGNEEELSELKAWLFKENIRLELANSELKRMEDKLLKERQQFQTEMAEINQRLVIERKRLKQDESFFDKKMEILKNGFAQLEADRKRLEKDKLQFEAEKNKLTFDVEIEQIYLAGNFSIKTESSFKELDRNASRYSGEFIVSQPKKKISLTNIERQGFPFFAGSITVKKTFSATLWLTELTQASPRMKKSPSVMRIICSTPPSIFIFLWCRPTMILKRKCPFQRRDSTSLSQRMRLSAAAQERCVS